MSAKPAGFSCFQNMYIFMCAFRYGVPQAGDAEHTALRQHAAEPRDQPEGDRLGEEPAHRLGQHTVAQQPHGQHCVRQSRPLLTLLQKKYRHLRETKKLPSVRMFLRVCL